MGEWVSDWLGGAALLVTGAVVTWLTRIGLVQQKHGERLAVLEKQADGVPGLLREIKDEIKGLRDDGRARGDKIYEHIDDVRRELRDEIKGKADKP